MKKIIIILFIVLLLASFVFGDKYTLSTEQKMFFSKIDEEFLEETDSDEWVYLIKQYGKNKVSILFPNEPEMEYFLDDQKEEHLRFYAEERGVRYNVYIEPYFDDFVEHYEEMFSEKIDTIPSWESHIHGTCLDVEYKKSQKALIKERILVTKNRIYRFVTETKIDIPDKHYSFIDSFKIIKPLA